MSTSSILIAGFGGQGILFTGKVLAYSGLISEKEVSWLPSYGPEMRGGTANCSIIISNSPVGSPIVSKPDVLIAMNLPSLEKYENAVNKNGYIFYDSSLINKDEKIEGVYSFAIPATKLAGDNNLSGLANMIILGKMIKESGILNIDEIKKGMTKMIPSAKAELLQKNIIAIEIGYNY